MYLEAHFLVLFCAGLFMAGYLLGAWTLTRGQGRKMIVWPGQSEAPRYNPTVIGRDEWDEAAMEKRERQSVGPVDGLGM